MSFFAPPADRATGVVMRESDGLTGAGLDPFWLVEPGRAFLAHTTDLTLPSPPLVEFSLLDGVTDVNLHPEVDLLAPVLADDRLSDSLFFPTSGGVNPGIHVVEDTTGRRLTAEAVSTAGPPRQWLDPG